MNPQLKTIRKLITMVWPCFWYLKALSFIIKMQRFEYGIMETILLLKYQSLQVYTNSIYVNYLNKINAPRKKYVVWICVSQFSVSVIWRYLTSSADRNFCHCALWVNVDIEPCTSVDCHYINCSFKIFWL
jgi:hypothetical protein